ncbi:MAG: DNA alkylation repair protein [Bacteroidales bacterium]|nr:DNA alkylation repair protein [Bacteroidales bacterium]
MNPKNNTLDFLKVLDNAFEINSNAEIASGQKAYMKNLFEFYGIKAPVRQNIQKAFFHKEFLPPKKELERLAETLWEKPQREYQYFAQELVQQYTKQFEQNDIHLFEFMITHKSWWDTVDFIASKLVGEYFKIFPGQRDNFVKKWIDSKNIWLQRTAVLFQLNYKKDVDTVLLASAVHALLGSEEFFINKAIGWMLRQYTKTNPEWVIDFCDRTPLAKLSRKEALRLVH